LWWRCGFSVFSRVFRDGVLVLLLALLLVLIFFEGIFWHVVLDYTRLC